MTPACARLACLLAALLLMAVPPLAAPVSDTIVLRGHRLTLHVYGTRGGPPVVLTSGDGGWIRLAPHVAERLAADGFFVVGVDAKAYLESFTSGRGTLTQADEPHDYAQIVAYAARDVPQQPLLVGTSEGAGLSVLAATDATLKPLIAGVIAIGLPEVSELGWRWRDAVIYLTHGVPKEPTFNATAIIGQVAPVPLAAIHSLHDDFIPLETVRRMLDRAVPPWRLWTVDAADHNFSNNLGGFDRALTDAIGWVRQQMPR